ncbi:MAG: hypothetical protein MUP98_06850 [Candidatus Aminicenantes bacterium]|nr:hypothetical protein [Candidatus Aminicenantes bacterium]
MDPLLLVGTRIVILALIAYSVAGYLLYKKKSPANIVVYVQSTGLFFDVAATALMILGSTNTPFSIHGFLGYSALVGMIIETTLLWKFRMQKGKESPVSKGFQMYSKLALAWWVTAFVVGALLVFLK